MKKFKDNDTKSAKITAELNDFTLQVRACPATHSPKGSVDSFGPSDATPVDEE